MRCVSLCALFAGAAAHAGLIIPTTRNSIDRLAKGFSVDGLGLRTPCTCSDRGTGNSQGCRGDGCGPGLGAKCASGTDLNVRAEGGAGQPCLWWSQVKMASDRMHVPPVLLVQGNKWSCVRSHRDVALAVISA